MQSLAYLALSLFIGSALADDPSLLLSDYPAGVSSFTLRDIFTHGDVIHGPGGTRATVNPGLFPAMQGQGLTYIQSRLKPCGVNVPHTHPRASEMLTLVNGGPLQVGFVDTKGEAHTDIVHPGGVTVIPRGMLHHELNLGKQTAFYISALNSENPGVLPATGALLNTPTRALATSLNVSADEVSTLRQNRLPFGYGLEMPHPSICTPGQNISANY